MWTTFIELTENSSLALLFPFYQFTGLSTRTPSPILLDFPTALLYNNKDYYLRRFLVAISNVWQESLIGRLTAGTFRAWQQSALCGWATGTPGYSHQEATRLSLVGRASATAARTLGRPLEIIGEAFRRGLAESLLSKIQLPSMLKNSQVLRSLAGIRVETLLWLAFSYILVDYALRKSLGTTSSLASNWDELLLIFAFLAWPVQMALRGKLTYRLTPLDLPIVL
jgi:hypothetical protein